METLKAIGLGIVFVAVLLVAALIGQSKLPKSEYCEINYRLNGTWEAVGWNPEDGFPRTDCKLPSDRFTEEDGTWDWK
jgi:hypothetical protein